MKVKALRRKYIAWLETLIVPKGKRAISFRVWRRWAVAK